MRTLLAAGADVAHVRPDGVFVLMAASVANELECLRALLYAGAGVAQTGFSDDFTALLGASLKGHVDCVRALLEARTTVAQAARDGSTALMLASQRGQLGCVRGCARCSGWRRRRAGRLGWLDRADACEPDGLRGVRTHAARDRR